MSKNCCSIWEKFDEKNNLIKEYNYWKLLIRKNHTKLGSCVAITKKHHESFSDLSSDEISDFLFLVKGVETTLKKSFNYDKINWLMLMMLDNHTHFHIFPRYYEPQNFAGINWIDGGVKTNLDPLIQKRESLNQETLNQIKNEIIKNL